MLPLATSQILIFKEYGVILRYPPATNTNPPFYATFDQTLVYDINDERIFKIMKKNDDDTFLALTHTTIWELTILIVGATNVGTVGTWSLLDYVNPFNHAEFISGTVFAYVLGDNPDTLRFYDYALDSYSGPDIVSIFKGIGGIKRSQQILHDYYFLQGRGIYKATLPSNSPTLLYEASSNGQHLSLTYISSAIPTDNKLYFVTKTQIVIWNIPLGNDSESFNLEATADIMVEDVNKGLYYFDINNGKILHQVWDFAYLYTYNTANNLWEFTFKKHQFYSYGDMQAELVPSKTYFAITTRCGFHVVDITTFIILHSYETEFNGLHGQQSYVVLQNFGVWKILSNPTLSGSFRKLTTGTEDAVKVGVQGSYPDSPSCIVIFSTGQIREYNLETTIWGDFSISYLYNDWFLVDALYLNSRTLLERDLSYMAIGYNITDHTHQAFFVGSPKRDEYYGKNCLRNKPHHWIFDWPIAEGLYRALIDCNGETLTFDGANTVYGVADKYSVKVRKMYLNSGCLSCSYQCSNHRDSYPNIYKVWPFEKDENYQDIGLHQYVVGQILEMKYLKWGKIVVVDYRNIIVLDYKQTEIKLELKFDRIIRERYEGVHSNDYVSGRLFFYNRTIYHYSPVLLTNHYYQDKKIAHIGYCQQNGQVLEFNCFRGLDYVWYFEPMKGWIGDETDDYKIDGNCQDMIANCFKCTFNHDGCYLCNNGFILIEGICYPHNCPQTESFFNESLLNPACIIDIPANLGATDYLSVCSIGTLTFWDYDATVGRCMASCDQTKGFVRITKKTGKVCLTDDSLCLTAKKITYLNNFCTDCEGWMKLSTYDCQATCEHFRRYVGPDGINYCSELKTTITLYDDSTSEECIVRGVLERPIKIASSLFGDTKETFFVENMQDDYNPMLLYPYVLIGVQPGQDLLSRFWLKASNITQFHDKRQEFHKIRINLIQDRLMGYALGDHWIMTYLEVVNSIITLQCGIPTENEQRNPAAAQAENFGWGEDERTANMKIVRLAFKGTFDVQGILKIFVNFPDKVVDNPQPSQASSLSVQDRWKQLFKVEFEKGVKYSDFSQEFEQYGTHIMAIVFDYNIPTFELTQMTLKVNYTDDEVVYYEGEHIEKWQKIDKTVSEGMADIGTSSAGFITKAIGILAMLDDSVVSHLQRIIMTINHFRLIIMYPILYNNDFLSALEMLVTPFGDWFGNMVADQYIYFDALYIMPTANDVQNFSRFYMYSAGMGFVTNTIMKLAFFQHSFSVNSGNSCIYNKKVDKSKFLSLLRRKTIVSALSCYHIDFFGVMLRLFACFLRPAIATHSSGILGVIDILCAQIDFCFAMYVEFFLYTYIQGTNDSKLIPYCHKELDKILQVHLINTKKSKKYLNLHIYQNMMFLLMISVGFGLRRYPLVIIGLNGFIVQCYLLWTIFDDFYITFGRKLLQMIHLTLLLLVTSMQAGFYYNNRGKWSGDQESFNAYSGFATAFQLLLPVIEVIDVLNMAILSLRKMIINKVWPNRYKTKEDYAKEQVKKEEEEAQKQMNEEDKLKFIENLEKDQQATVLPNEVMLQAMPLNIEDSEQCQKAKKQAKNDRINRLAQGMTDNDGKSEMSKTGTLSMNKTSSSQGTTDSQGNKRIKKIKNVTVNTKNKMASFLLKRGDDKTQLSLNKAIYERKSGMETDTLSGQKSLKSEDNLSKISSNSEDPIYRDAKKKKISVHPGVFQAVGQQFSKM